MSLQLCPACMSRFEAAEGAERPKVCPHCRALLPPEAQGSPSGTISSGDTSSGDTSGHSTNVPRPDASGSAPPKARRPTALVFGTPVEQPGGPGPSAFVAAADATRGPRPAASVPDGGETGDPAGVSARGVPPPVNPPPEAGGTGEDCFGLYELISKIGSSDVAVSYRARDRARGRIVALKVLAPGPCSSREEISALRERARVAKRLEHPNVARVLEVGTADGTDYVAMEFVEGHALTKFLEGDTFSVGEAVVLGGTLASALDHAHSEGVIHGDLRPSNVIIDDYGNPRLTDFGFAREYWRVEPDELKRSARSDMPLPQHMAPEQLAGEEPTPRSDVYGLGALMYHMLTGHPPFPGTSLFQVVLEMDRGRPTPPGALSAGIPAPVNVIVMKCLERDPAHRFASAGELALEIDRFLRGEKVNARVPGQGMRLVRAMRRRWKAAAAVAVLAAASGAGAWYAARSQEVAALGGPDYQARVCMADAYGLVRARRYDEAARAFGEIERSTPVSHGIRAKAAAGRGLAELRAGRPAAAIDAYERALDALPDDAELHRQLAMAIWHARGDMSDVVRELERSFKFDPARADKARCQFEYGRACAEAGSTDKARSALLQVRRIDPSYKRADVEKYLKRLDEHAN